MKKILFVIDKLELKYFEFNKLVTNFWLIKEFLNNKCDVWITINPNLHLRDDVAYATCFESYTDGSNIFYKNIEQEIVIDSFDIVMFRPDPPVDIDYINATYIFDFVTKPQIINSPKAIRNFNEKLHSLYFSEYMTPSIVTSSMKEIEKFLSVHKQIVLKPLNQCFGSGVMFLYEGDPNTHTIINTVTNNEKTIAMVQKYIPEVTKGDIRVLTLGDKILPYCIKKLPGKDDFKFNTHNDNFVVKSEFTESDLQFFTPIAKRLNDMGIVMAGLDVIGKNIIEINVTSPCYFIKEINSAYNIHLEKEITNYLLTPNLLSL
ncbi:MAG: hypothetical protein MJ231_04485 [bacterium]|nr:hypothetical protein [bacterium]